MKMKYWMLTAILLGAGLTLYAQRKQRSVAPTVVKEIYFAGGCFWGTEHFMKQIRGVKKTVVGYANGRYNGHRPSYQEVCTGSTGFAEAVKVVYDSSVVDLALLVRLYFRTIDPTSINRQGNDQGTQYRTGIYFTDAADEASLYALLEEEAKVHVQPVVVEVKKLQNFYVAERQHQDYLERNVNGYCHIRPELFEMARQANMEKWTPPVRYEKKDDATLRRELTPIQYAVTQQNATEYAFSNEYWNEKRAGIYVDITTGEPLFVSTDKFMSTCGWPSFSRPISSDVIVKKEDLSKGMERVEVRSRTGDAHLGHVFTDGPKSSGGLRYCINSASLRFVPKEKMKEEGYGAYLPLLKKRR